MMALALLLTYGTSTCLLLTKNLSPTPTQTLAMQPAGLAQVDAHSWVSLDCVFHTPWISFVLSVEFDCFFLLHSLFCPWWFHVVEFKTFHLSNPMCGLGSFRPFLCWRVQKRECRWVEIQYVQQQFLFCSYYYELSSLCLINQIMMQTHV